MYIGISVECTFEENLLIMSIHHHAIAHMVAFWMKLSYKVCCWCASNGLQSTSRHLACRTQLVLDQQRNSQNYVQCGPQVLVSNLFILCVHSCWPDVFVNRVIAMCLGCEKQPCLSFNRVS